MISILLRFSYLVYLWLHDVLEHENFYDVSGNDVDCNPVVFSYAVIEAIDDESSWSKH